MPDPEKLEPINLGSIARGAGLEYFERALAKVAANIADKDTPPTKSREIVLHFKFKPDSDRRKLEVTTSCEIKLAASAEHNSVAYTGKDTANQVLIFDRDPRQDLLFEPPQEKDNLLNFGNPPTA